MQTLCGLPLSPSRTILLPPPSICLAPPVSSSSLSMPIEMPNNIVFRRLRAAARVAPRALLLIRLNRRTTPVEPAPATFGDSDAVVPSTSSTAVTHVVNPLAAVLTAGAREPDRMHLGSMRISREAAKDILVLSLEALSESADVFPPLKSVVGGLLYFTKRVEVTMVHSSIQYVSLTTFVAACIWQQGADRRDIRPDRRVRCLAGSRNTRRDDAITRSRGSHPGSC